MAVSDGPDAVLIVSALFWQNPNDCEASTDAGVISARRYRDRLPGFELVSGYHLASTNLFVGRVRISAMKGLVFDTRSADPATFPPQNGQGRRADGGAQAIHGRAVSPFRHPRR